MAQKTKLTKGQIAQFVEVIRSIKGFNKMTPEGALNIVKNGISFGKIAKESEETLKTLMEGLRTDEYVGLSESAEKIKKIAEEDRTDTDNETLENFDKLNKSATKELNFLNEKLAKEVVDIEILKISEEDFKAIIKHEKNQDIIEYGFELLFTTFVE